MIKFKIFATVYLFKGLPVTHQIGYIPDRCSHGGDAVWKIGKKYFQYDRLWSYIYCRNSLQIFFLNIKYCLITSNIFAITGIITGITTDLVNFPVILPMIIPVVAKILLVISSSFPSDYASDDFPVVSLRKGERVNKLFRAWNIFINKWNLICA